MPRRRPCCAFYMKPNDVLLSSWRTLTFLTCKNNVSTSKREVTWTSLFKTPQRGFILNYRWVPLWMMHCLFDRAVNSVGALILYSRSLVRPLFDTVWYSNVWCSVKHAIVEQRRPGDSHKVGPCPQVPAHCKSHHDMSISQTLKM